MSIHPCQVCPSCMFAALTLEGQATWGPRRWQIVHKLVCLFSPRISGISWGLYSNPKIRRLETGNYEVKVLSVASLETEFNHLLFSVHKFRCPRFSMDKESRCAHSPTICKDKEHIPIEKAEVEAGGLKSIPSNWGNHPRSA